MPVNRSPELCVAKVTWVQYLLHHACPLRAVTCTMVVVDSGCLVVDEARWCDTAHIRLLFAVCQSADYDPHHPGTVRRDGSYIYEEFLTTGGTDVKVYTVGPRCVHRPHACQEQLQEKTIACVVFGN